MWDANVPGKNIPPTSSNSTTSTGIYAAMQTPGTASVPNATYQAQRPHMLPLESGFMGDARAARYSGLHTPGAPTLTSEPRGAAMPMPGTSAYPQPFAQMGAMGGNARPALPVQAPARPPGARRGRPPRNPRPPAQTTQPGGQDESAPYMARPPSGAMPFTPSLSAPQQQAIMARAVQLVKAQDQPSFTPLHALLQMGFVFVRNAQLPNAPPNAQAGGTILRADEAATLGLLPPQAQGVRPPAPLGYGQSVPFGRPMPFEPAVRPEDKVPAAMLPGAPADVPLVRGGAPPPKSAAGVPVTPQNTRLTPLPSATTQPYPWAALTPADVAELEEIMRTDAKFLPVLQTQHKRGEAELYVHAARAMHPPLPQVPPKTVPWWEKAAHEPNAPRISEPLRIVYPAQRQRAQEQGVRGVRAAVPLSGAEIERVANTPESLVPIRLELDHEPFKLRDTFTWNAAEDDASLEAFAVAICEDMGLPVAVFVPLIKGAVQAQVNEYAAAMALRPEPGLHGDSGDATGKAGQGTLGTDSERIWQRLRTRVLHGGEAEHDEHDDEQKDDTGHAGEGHEAAVKREGEGEDVVPAKGAPSSADNPPRSGAALPTTDPLPAPVESTLDQDLRDELRILIKLDILVGAQNLVDQFEWDILSADSMGAERFAEAFAADLGLPGEFKTAIVHAIREQVSTHLRLLFVLGYPFNKLASMDEEIRTAFLPEVDASQLARRHGEVDAYTPKLVQLTPTDALHLEREHEREMRRKRRQTKGRRGINLAEREPQRTIRSVPVYGLQGGVPDAASAGHSTRRAAAAAASASIASLGEPADDTSSPAPPKRIRTDRQEVHFRYPGGLGAADAPAVPHFRSRTLAQTPLDALGRRTPTQAPPPTESVPRGRPPKDRTSDLSLARGARPEDLERQHPNMFDGVWHCGNCGLPGYLAPGRRKGPAGEKTLCGPCGKYYHRHRRMESVTYTRDPAYHIKRLKRVAPDDAADAAMGDSTELPLLPEDSDSDAADAPPQPPRWLVDAAEASRRKYPNDLFQVQLRPRLPDAPEPAEEWRIKCADCPGKVYKPGPGESLINFEIHLKNRSHRAAVARRLGTAP